MGVIGKHLDDRQRLGSVILPASVIANRADGDVDVKIRNTGKTVRASRGTGEGTYTPGQVVQLSRTDASGVTSNTGWVVIGPPPSSMKGTSKSVPLDETTTPDGAAITLIVPSPVEIVAGGDVVTVALHGAFSGVRGVSFSTGELINDVAPTSTPTLITLQVRATSIAPLGEYDLLLDGVVVAPGLFRVSAGAAVPARSIWLLAYDPLNAIVVVRLDASDMSVFSTTPLPAGAVSTGDLKVIGARVVARASTTAISIDNAGSVDLVTGLTLDCSDTHSGVWNGNMVGGSQVSPCDLSLLDGALLSEVMIACNVEFSTNTDVDGDTAWIRGDNPTKLIEFDLASATEIRRATITGGHSPGGITHDSTHLYIIDSDTVYKLDKTTLAVVATSPSVGQTFVDGQNRAIMLGGSLVFSTQGALIVMDPAALTFTSIALSHEASGICPGLDADTVLVADIDFGPGGGVSVVDLLTSTVTRTALPAGYYITRVVAT